MFKLATVAGVAAVAAHPSFEEFTATHRKVYATSEEKSLRSKIYYDNLKYIDSHNAKGLSWTLGPTPFADMTNAEFKARFTGGVSFMGNAPEEAVGRLPTNDLPAAIDWTQKNAVTAIKNQGTCGSCWAFSTTGSVEGIHAIKTGNLVALSEQQLIDCSISYGNEGCHGGDMGQAMKYIASSSGLCSEADYPYQDASFTDDGGAPGEFPCKATGTTPCKPAATITGYEYVTPNNTDALQAAVAMQPVSVAVEADTDFQFYFGGIVTDQNCGYNLDHGVLVVGYGSANGTDFWKVKNSWGLFWGEWGYIRLQRGGDVPPQGICGVQIQPVYPTIDTN